MAKYLFLFFLILGCSKLPKQFEKEKKGFRHLPSQAIFPAHVGNYSFLDNNEQKALVVDKKFPRRSSALYLDYKSGGQMTSILFRPFAKVETIPKSTKIKFDELIKRELENLGSENKILGDFSTTTKKGFKLREIRISSQESFMNYNFSDMSLQERVPAVTKLVYLEKGNYIIFLRTAYPSSEDDELSRPNREFVDAFIKAQN